MTTKLAKEIRAEAWKALGEGQYWTFFAGYMVLTMLVGVMTVPAAVALFAGVHFPAYCHSSSQAASRRSGCSLTRK